MTKPRIHGDPVAGVRAATPPRDLIDNLCAALTVDVIDDDNFRSAAVNAHWPRIFGGQVVAQALVAASLTAPPDRTAHSLHGYFVRAGRPGEPVHYRVFRDHDGTSFSSRRVVAHQNEIPIFTMGASFHIGESGFEHAQAMLDVPPPESLRSETTIRQEQAQAIRQTVRGFTLREMPIELRPVTPRDFINPAPRPPLQHFWLKPVAPLPDDPLLHRAVLAYVSDMMLLSTALLPHGVHWATSEITNASLDHSLWLHGKPDFSDWMLYTIDSPWAGGARGLSRGSVYDRSGRLIASVAQEGLLRPRQGQHIKGEKA